MSKKITILGSTGSIGQSTLRVVRSMTDPVNVYGLTCSKNLSELSKQIEEFNPAAVAVQSEEIVVSEAYKKLKKKYTGIEFLEGDDGLIEIAGRKVDVLVSAIVGAAGLKPTINAIGAARRIALANKETLVMSGSIFMERLQHSDTELIPVDSEHSAVFSLLKNISSDTVERIILTASGGALRDVAIGELISATPEMALSHPNWDMGNKITIDSATLMNKGLEVIEAHHLFGFDYDSIDVILHPESIIHSMVETIDGAIYAHLGIADMALPIGYAIMYPGRMANSFERLKLEDVGALTFQNVDTQRYSSLDLCYSAGIEGGSMPAVLNAANEISVEAFLEKKILFTDIVKVVEKAMKRHSTVKNPELDDIFQADRETREMTMSIIKGE